MERTDWYPGRIRPVRSGEYETKLLDISEVQMRHYDVTFNQWYWITSNGELLRSDFGHSDCFRKAVWRGLTEEA